MSAFTNGASASSPIRAANTAACGTVRVRNSAQIERSSVA